MPDQVNSESLAAGEKAAARIVRDLEKAIESNSGRSDLDTIFSTERYADYAPRAFLDEVLKDIRHMAHDLEILRRVRLRVACIDFGGGELAPFSILGLGQSVSPSQGAPFRRPFGLPPGRREILDKWALLVEICQRFDDKLVLQEQQDLLPGLRKSLTQFIAMQFEWLRMLSFSKSADPGASPGGGGPGDGGSGSFGGGGMGNPPQAMLGAKLAMHVECQTRGLRLHVAPAYFIHWRVFGGPTSPVLGHVSPGRHVFAGEGRNLPGRLRDPGIFHTPPTYRAVLTRF